MLSVLLITFPFFALVLCGYLAARTRLLPQPAIPGLNAFVLYFALPCMLYRFGASTPIAQLIDPAAAGVYLLCALVMVAGTVLATRGPRMGWNDAAFGALVAAFPNTGFMGVPLLVALLGAAAAGPAILTIAIDMVITSSLCVALAHLGHAGGGARAVRQALIGVAKNPMPWAVLAGACASALQWMPPQPVAATVGMLAAAATPVALFSIGAVLWRSRSLSLADRVKLGDIAAQSPRQRTTDLVGLVALKLVVHPLLLLLGLWVLQRVGVMVPGVVGTTLLLIAALPSAGNVSLLAERFGADNGRVARVILWTTLIAVLSFNGVVFQIFLQGG